jgi:hypothetical protein
MTCSGEDALAIAYHCDRVKGITYAIWDGPITADEWRATAQRQAEDSEWPAGGFYISDLRKAVLDVQEFRAALGSVADVYRNSGKLPVGMKHAILAPSVFGLADDFQEWMSRTRIESIAFNDLETACTWLGIDVEEADSVLKNLHVELRKKTPNL